MSSSAQAFCNSTEKSSQLCGNLFYDVKKYTCCDGNITQGAFLSCCGRTVYNTLESSCCNNEVTVGLSQTVSYCCRSKAYNPLNQICCGGNISNKTSAHTACCHSELYDLKTHLCCRKTVFLKETDSHVCCGNTTFDKLMQCCCPDNLEVENRDSTCCKQNLERESRFLPNASQPATSVLHLLKDNGIVDSQDSVHSNTLYCGLEPYNPLEDVCCSGKLVAKKSGVTQCCGAEPYELSEEGVMCCDGHLYRDQPAGSICTGNVPYSPHNYTICQKHVHLPAGQQCCGKKTFDPHEEICCNGRSYKGSEKYMACCGSHTYNVSAGKHICCSGHLHKLTHLQNYEEAGCCGPLLLSSKEQQCCHSAENTLVYKIQPGHSCCGHWYYNMSLWSCCAGHLIPKPTHGSQAKMEESKLIRPLLDYSKSAICNKPVLLGRVASVAVKHNGRFVVLKEVLEVNATDVTSCRNSLEVGPLDHCLFPALKLGRTYLWTKNTLNKYEPLASVIGLNTPIHTILSLCQSNRMCYST
ncbi:galaxin-like isoform X2 [Pygocentrus nattereri]|uniref:galaxin-like isoform X2 n=1 Tax=Pygocentrus nattereri TaxID=42514 RepID=UPI00189150A2|nr:galaxin-like isoform X2 [Pygocentrus nattereri]